MKLVPSIKELKIMKGVTHIGHECFLGLSNEIGSLNKGA